MKFKETVIQCLIMKNKKKCVSHNLFLSGQPNTIGYLLVKNTSNYYTFFCYSSFLKLNAWKVDFLLFKTVRFKLLRKTTRRKENKIDIFSLICLLLHAILSLTKVLHYVRECVLYVFFIRIKIIRILCWKVVKN